MFYVSVVYVAYASHWQGRACYLYEAVIDQKHLLCCWLIEVVEA